MAAQKDDLWRGVSGHTRYRTSLHRNGWTRSMTPKDFYDLQEESDDPR